MIGSHDGRLTNSTERALRYVELCEPFRSALGIPKAGLLAEESDIRECLGITDLKQYYRLFQTLENEAYVRIQTAKTEEEIRDIRKKLDLIYSTMPPGLMPAADQFFDYHDYCARARLAERESLEAYLPSSS